MKTLYLLVATYISISLFNLGVANAKQATTTQSVNKTTIATHASTELTNNLASPATAPPKKDPLTVAFFNHGKKPKQKYVVVGKETISKYNFVGVKRQEAIVHDAMRTLAASMGGDAIIDITHDDETISGTVIAFQKKSFA